MHDRAEMFDSQSRLEDEASTRGLLGRLREGDRSAGERLFAMHRKRLLFALRARLPRAARPLLDHEELVQESLFAALRSVGRFEWRGQGAFLAWLVQIALHKLQDEERLRAGRPALLSMEASGERGASSSSRFVDGDQTPSESAASAEERELLMRALDELSDSDRDLVVRRKVLDQSYHTIAQDLEIEVGTARMRVRRALLKMSLGLEDRGD
jgi:RNA polymerase sigma factor (sigma-70 family)